jgi:hypothetical protein
LTEKPKVSKLLSAFSKEALEIELDGVTSPIVSPFDNGFGFINEILFCAKLSLVASIKPAEAKTLVFRKFLLSIYCCYIY